MRVQNGTHFYNDHDCCSNYDLLNGAITGFVNLWLLKPRMSLYTDNKPRINKELNHYLNMKKIAFLQNDQQKVKELNKI